MTRLSAAVIGSGFGGLAAAIRLQAAGCKTVIFEKRDLAGGRAYVYHDDGFTFDAGPTVVTAPDCLRELFTLAGKCMEDYVELLPSILFIGYFGRMATSSIIPLMLSLWKTKFGRNLPETLRAISSS